MEMKEENKAKAGTKREHVSNAELFVCFDVMMRRAASCGSGFSVPIRTGQGGRGSASCANS